MTIDTSGATLKQLAGNDLTVEGNHSYNWCYKNGIALIIHGSVRHYHFAREAFSIEAEELKDGISEKRTSNFYLGRSHASELSSRLVNPPIDDSLAARLLGSRSAGGYGYQGDQCFNLKYFDCVPTTGEGGDGFKVLRNGSDTLLYLCRNATEGVDEIEVVEALVRLNDADRKALAGTLLNLTGEFAGELAAKQYGTTVQFLLRQPNGLPIRR